MATLVDIAYKGDLIRSPAFIFGKKIENGVVQITPGVPNHIERRTTVKEVIVEGEKYNRFIPESFDNSANDLSRNTATFKVIKAYREKYEEYGDTSSRWVVWAERVDHGEVIKFIMGWTGIREVELLFRSADRQITIQNILKELEGNINDELLSDISYDLLGY